jgi:hypothetical protein
MPLRDTPKAAERDRRPTIQWENVPFPANGPVGITCLGLGLRGGMGGISYLDTTYEGVTSFWP